MPSLYVCVYECIEHMFLICRYCFYWRLIVTHLDTVAFHLEYLQKCAYAIIIEVVFERLGFSLTKITFITLAHACNCEIVNVKN